MLAVNNQFVLNFLFLNIPECDISKSIIECQLIKHINWQINTQYFRKLVVKTDCIYFDVLTPRTQGALFRRESGFNGFVYITGIGKKFAETGFPTKKSLVSTGA